MGPVAVFFFPTVRFTFLIALFSRLGTMGVVKVAELASHCKEEEDEVR